MSRLRLAVSDVRFTHGQISLNFSCGTPVEETIDQLKQYIKARNEYLRQKGTTESDIRPSGCETGTKRISEKKCDSKVAKETDKSHTQLSKVSEACQNQNFDSRNSTCQNANLNENLEGTTQNVAIKVSDDTTLQRLTISPLEALEFKNQIVFPLKSPEEHGDSRGDLTTTNSSSGGRTTSHFSYGANKPGDSTTATSASSFNGDLCFNSSQFESNVFSYPTVEPSDRTSDTVQNGPACPVPPVSIVIFERKFYCTSNRRLYCWRQATEQLAAEKGTKNPNFVPGEKQIPAWSTAPIFELIEGIHFELVAVSAHFFRGLSTRNEGRFTKLYTPNTCLTCSKTFKTKMQLQQHWEGTGHEGVKEFIQPVMKPVETAKTDETGTKDNTNSVSNVITAKKGIWAQLEGSSSDDDSDASTPFVKRRASIQPLQESPIPSEKVVVTQPQASLPVPKTLIQPALKVKRDFWASLGGSDSDSSDSDCTLKKTAATSKTNNRILATVPPGNDGNAEQSEQEPSPNETQASSPPVYFDIENHVNVNRGLLCGVRFARGCGRFSTRRRRGPVSSSTSFTTGACIKAVQRDTPAEIDEKITNFNLDVARTKCEANETSIKETFQCWYCGYSFKRISSCMQHQNTCNKEKKLERMACHVVDDKLVVKKVRTKARRQNQDDKLLATTSMQNSSTGSRAKANFLNIEIDRATQTRLEACTGFAKLSEFGPQRNDVVLSFKLDTKVATSLCDPYGAELNRLATFSNITSIRILPKFYEMSRPKVENEEKDTEDSGNNAGELENESEKGTAGNESKNPKSQIESENPAEATTEESTINATITRKPKESDKPEPTGSTKQFIGNDNGLSGLVEEEKALQTKTGPILWPEYQTIKMVGQKENVKHCARRIEEFYYKQTGKWDLNLHLNKRHYHYAYPFDVRKELPLTTTSSKDDLTTDAPLYLQSKVPMVADPDVFLFRIRLFSLGPSKIRQADYLVRENEFPEDFHSLCKLIQHKIGCKKIRKISMSNCRVNKQRKRQKAEFQLESRDPYSRFDANPCSFYRSEKRSHQTRSCLADHYMHEKEGSVSTSTKATPVTDSVLSTDPVPKPLNALEEEQLFRTPITLGDYLHENLRPTKVPSRRKHRQPNSKWSSLVKKFVTPASREYLPLNRIDDGRTRDTLSHENAVIEDGPWNDRGSSNCVAVGISNDHGFGRRAEGIPNLKNEHMEKSSKPSDVGFVSGVTDEVDTSSPIPQTLVEFKKFWTEICTELASKTHFSKHTTPKWYVYL